MIKQIESEKEDVTDVSENLTRKNAQVESIQRLVTNAEERVNAEKETLEQDQQPQSKQQCRRKHFKTAHDTPTQLHQQSQQNGLFHFH